MHNIVSDKDSYNIKPFNPYSPNLSVNIPIIESSPKSNKVINHNDASFDDSKNMISTFDTVKVKIEEKAKKLRPKNARVRR